MDSIKAYLLALRPQHVRKAIAGGTAADLPLVLGCLTGNHFDGADARNIVTAFLVGALAVFGIKNTPHPAGVRKQDGAANLNGVVTVLLVVALILVICWAVGHPVRLG